MIERIKDYFTFNRKEQRGLITLLGLMLLVAMANLLLPSFIQDEAYDMSAFRQEAEVFLAAMAKADSLAISDTAKRTKYNYGYKLPDTASRKIKTQKYEPHYKKPETVIIELNSADSGSLLNLNGIGPYYAGRIIRYREKLGGYFQTEQLLEIRGMDTIRINQFKQQICIDTSLIRKIDLNSVAFKDLLKHPYFEYYLVKAIFNKKDELGRFDSIAQLNSIDVMYKELFDKISPYLTASP